MHTEHEITFLDISIETIQQKLTAIGAHCVSPRRLTRRMVFICDDCTWIRVRDNGDSVTITMKQYSSDAIDGMYEQEIYSASSFTDTCHFIEAIGYTHGVYQENYRESWQYQQCTICIDTWPHIPSFIEIESTSIDEINLACRDLGFSIEYGIYGGVYNVYKQYYSIDKNTFNRISPLSFTAHFPHTRL